MAEIIVVRNWQASVHDSILVESKERIFISVFLKFSWATMELKNLEFKILDQSVYHGIQECWV
jgi:hypothetical protein